MAMIENSWGHVCENWGRRTTRAPLWLWRGNEWIAGGLGVAWVYRSRARVVVVVDEGFLYSSRLLILTIDIWLFLCISLPVAIVDFIALLLSSAIIRC